MKLITVLLIFLVSACVTTTEYEMLRQDVSGLMRESYETKKEINSLKDKTAVSVKEDSFAAVRESQAEINSRLTEISMSLQELRGRFEENKYFLEKRLKDYSTETDIMKAQITSIENQIRRLKNSGITEGSTQSSEPSDDQLAAGDTTPLIKRAPESIVSDTQLPVSEKKDQTEAYEIAYQAFKDKKYKEARERFEAYIKEYPENTLTDNAQFWIAETYFAEKDFESSILSYETLFKKYPDSEKTSGALLKQGFAFIELGDKKTGKIILEKLIEKFPDSKEAELAKKRLK